MGFDRVTTFPEADLMGCRYGRLTPGPPMKNVPKGFPSISTGIFSWLDASFTCAADGSAHSTADNRRHESLIMPTLQHNGARESTARSGGGGEVRPPAPRHSPTPSPAPQTAHGRRG